MNIVETAALAVGSFFIGAGVGIHITVDKWQALVDRSQMNGRRWRLMFLEASEKYWRARGRCELESFCEETADSYKKEADTLRPEVTP